MKQVNFSEEQIKAIYEQFSSCLKNAGINADFNAYAFRGAIECSL